MDKFLKEIGVEDYHPTEKKVKLNSGNQFYFFRGRRKFLLDLLVFPFIQRAAPVAPDIAAYEIIKRAMKSGDYNSAAVAPRSAKILNHYIQKYKSREIKKYLDIGCGACFITKELAQLIKTKGHGADLVKTFEKSWEKRPAEIEFKFITNESIIGYKEKWDLITAIMVLHHIPEVEKTIAEISKSLVPGGLFVIKEHDCFTETEKILVDIEHCLYIVQQNDDWKEKIYDQYIECRSWVEWAFLMQKYDMRLLFQGPWGYSYQNYDNTRKSIMIFQKMKK